MMARLGVTALVVATLIAGTTGFVVPMPSKARATRVGTELYSDTTEIDILPNMPPIKDISYGEASRKYRRTVYTHDDWRKHRSSDRFIYYLASLGVSGVYKNIGREVGATTAIAAIVCLYNALVGGYTDFSGVEHAPVIANSWLTVAGLPLTPFSLSTSSLGLLLGMYTVNMNDYHRGCTCTYES